MCPCPSRWKTSSSPAAAHRRRGRAHALPQERDAVAHRQADIWIKFETCSHCLVKERGALTRCCSSRPRNESAASSPCRPATMPRAWPICGPARHSRTSSCRPSAQHEGGAYARPWRARRPARRHASRSRHRGASAGGGGEAGVRASYDDPRYHRGPGHDRLEMLRTCRSSDTLVSRWAARHDSGLRRRGARAQARPESDRRRKRPLSRPCTSCWPASVMVGGDTIARASPCATSARRRSPSPAAGRLRADRRRGGARARIALSSEVEKTVARRGRGRTGGPLGMRHFTGRKSGCAVRRQHRHPPARSVLLRGLGARWPLVRLRLMIGDLPGNSPGRRLIGKAGGNIVEVQSPAPVRRRGQGDRIDVTVETRGRDHMPRAGDGPGNRGIQVGC